MFLAARSGGAAHAGRISAECDSCYEPRRIWPAGRVSGACAENSAGGILAYQSAPIRGAAIAGDAVVSAVQVVRILLHLGGEAGIAGDFAFLQAGSRDAGTDD